MDVYFFWQNFLILQHFEEHLPCVGGCREFPHVRGSCHNGGNFGGRGSGVAPRVGE